jgi:hypothetical protein
MNFFKKILLVTELWYAISHIIVLFQIAYIMPNIRNGLYNKIYFSGDLISSLSSYYITRKNKTLVLIHFIVHLFVIIYLFNIYYMNFYNNIFNIAYNNLNNIPKNHYYLYNLLTTLDILCHIYNIKYLYVLLNKNKVK